MIDQFIDSTTNEIQMIVFQICNEEYSVPINCIQEIIMLQVPTRIPKSPYFVQGVINLRGNIIPVIDGKKRFNLSLESHVATSESRIIVMEVEDGTIGLIVDAVSEVVHLGVSDIEAPPVDMDDECDFLWGVGKYQDRLLILLNPEKFLNIDEKTDFKKLNKVSEIIKLKNEEKSVQKV